MSCTQGPYSDNYRGREMKCGQEPDNGGSLWGGGFGTKRCRPGNQRDEAQELAKLHFCALTFDMRGGRGR
jgi:hypothetical protein